MNLFVGRRLPMLGLVLSVISGTVWAGPPPNFSGNVSICGGRLTSYVDIQFASTASTATVLTRAEKPVPCAGCAPFPTANLDYWVKVQAKASQNPQSPIAYPWIGNEATQQGYISIAQPAIEVGHSTFVQASTCKITGTVTFSVKCPAGSPWPRDLVVFPREWAGCGK